MAVTLAACAEEEGTVSGTVTMNMNDTIYMTDSTVFPVKLEMNFDESVTLSGISFTDATGTYTLDSASFAIKGKFVGSVSASGDMAVTSITLAATIIVDGSTCTATMTDMTSEPAWACQ